MNDLEVLIAARKLLSSPSCWTQGEYARDEEGEERDPNDSDAICWCAMGAIGKINEELYYQWDKIDIDNNLLSKAAKELFDTDIVTVNDVLGHIAVLQMYDRAIEIAGGYGSN